MPDLTPFAQLPYPVGAEDPDGPAALMQLAEKIDPQLVLYAVNSADRDARYADLDNGLVITTSAPWTAWLRHPTGWLTLYEDTGQVEIPVTALEPGWSAGDVPIYIRRRQGQVGFRFSGSYASDIVASVTGSISDVPILSIPSGYRPQWTITVNFLGGFTSGQARIYASDTACRLSTMMPTSSLSAGTIIEVDGDWMGA